MRVTPIDTGALRSLPDVISMGLEVYHGTPTQMVKQMASEMGTDVGVSAAVSALLTALGHNRGILIAIPEDVPEDILATLFVYALLDSGVSRPVTATA